MNLIRRRTTNQNGSQNYRLVSKHSYWQRTYICWTCERDTSKKNKFDSSTEKNRNITVHFSIYWSSDNSQFSPKRARNSPKKIILLVFLTCTHYSFLRLVQKINVAVVVGTKVIMQGKLIAVAYSLRIQIETSSLWAEF